MHKISLYCVLNFVVLISDCRALLISSHPKEITIKNRGSYFGYSLLLQSGTVPRIIVGAPKGNSSYRNTGSVYQCAINTGVCSQYNLYTSGASTGLNKNGDFLGVALDGEASNGGRFFAVLTGEFFEIRKHVLMVDWRGHTAGMGNMRYTRNKKACAPRFTTYYDSKNYYMKGKCFYVKNSTEMNRDPLEFVPLQPFRPINFLHLTSSFYDSAFGQAGLSIKFLRESNQILTGAPGMVDWSGVLIESDLRTLTRHTAYPPRKVTSNRYGYFGYSIATGVFNGKPNRNDEIWYVAGAPRDLNLRGMVMLFQSLNYQGKILMQEEFFGEGTGSYFGASLMVAPKHGHDDIFVGAPMYSGRSYDEGCVYYYENDRKGRFRAPIKILGRRSTAGRFGTAITDLGNLALNEDHYVAISAPYEDDGLGAVYIYKKSQKFYELHQRISPQDLQIESSTTVKHFGLGLSNAVDVDGNVHPDLAVGAYGSDQVFIFYCKNVTNLALNLSTNTTTLYRNTTQFFVNCCVSLGRMNNITGERKLNLEVLVLDKRVIGNKNYSTIVTVNLGDELCKIYVVLLKNDSPNFDPIKIQLRSKLVDDSVFDETELEIPFTHGCGPDNICQTDLHIAEVVTEPKELIIGLHKELEIFVSVHNRGEPAFNVELSLSRPTGTSLVNMRECNLVNDSYVCLISSYLTSEKNKTFLLDVRSLELDVTYLNIAVSVKSLGQDLKMGNHQVLFHVPVWTKSTPYISGKSVPEGITSISNDGIPIQATNLVHTFIVENSGPSPLKLDLVIFVPKVAYKGSQLFRIDDAKEICRNIQLDCHETDKTFDWATLKNDAKIPSNSSVVIDCIRDGNNCSRFYCSGSYVHKSSTSVVFALEIESQIDSLVKLYERELKVPNTIIYVTSAILTNGSEIFQSSTFTSIYVLPASRPVPLWVYVISVISGTLLLGLLVFTLYKCNFFKREYKEMLNNEQALMEDVSEEPADNETEEISLN